MKFKAFDLYNESETPEYLGEYTLEELNEMELGELVSDMEIGEVRTLADWIGLRYERIS